MGRSKGGLTTRIHALVDANGLPILLKITPGQAHDGRSAADMFDSLSKGDVLLADRAYDSDALRAEMAERGVWANVRAMPQRVRKPAFSANLYNYATPSRGSSAKSNTTAPSPHATKNTPRTTSPSSNSPQPESG